MKYVLAILGTILALVAAFFIWLIAALTSPANAYGCSVARFLAKKHLGYVPQRGETVYVSRSAMKGKSQSVIDQTKSCAEQRGVTIVLVD